MTLKVSVKIPEFAEGLEQDLFDIKKNIVRSDIPQYLKAQQREGFPDDPDEYTLFLRNRGREQKRKLETIRPQYLKIGTKRTPLSFNFVALSNIQDVLDAVKFAYKEARKRAPVRTGQYYDSIVVSAGTRLIDIYAARPSDFDEDTTFYISSATAYSAIIEWGFYKKYYKTQSLPKGILYWVTQKTRKAYEGKISIRFRYLAGSEGGTYPVIEIARAGEFAGNDRRPGSSRRRRRRR